MTYGITLINHEHLSVITIYQLLNLCVLEAYFLWLHGLIKHLETYCAIKRLEQKVESWPRRLARGYASEESG